MHKFQPRSIARYGFKPQLGDFRDYPYVRRVTGTLPAAVDLRHKLPPCWDQGQLGSCTSFGIAGAATFLSGWEGSHLWLYYQERVIEGTVSQDSGATIRDGFKVIATLGLPKEPEWPYVEAKFKTKPPATVTADAAKECLVSQYQALDHSSFTMAQKLDNYRDCLASGLPFAFGFTVYESFESDAVAKTGIVPVPGAKEQVLGGHCVLCIGYTADGGWVCRNSWGTSWGDNGHFVLPAVYFQNADLASDFWVALAEADAPPAPAPPAPTGSFVTYGKSKVYHLPTHYPHKVGKPLVDTVGYQACKVCMKGKP